MRSLFLIAYPAQLSRRNPDHGSDKIEREFFQKARILFQNEFVSVLGRSGEKQVLTLSNFAQLFHDVFPNDDIEHEVGFQ